jgi:hypothetical protein
LAVKFFDRKQEMHQWTEKTVEKLVGSMPEMTSGLDALSP